MIAITLCLGLIIGPAGPRPADGRSARSSTGAYLLAVLANFAYLYPVLAAQVIPYAAWCSADVVPQLDLSCRGRLRCSDLVGY